jgi:hypothetical protein
MLRRMLPRRSGSVYEQVSAFQFFGRGAEGSPMPAGIFCETLEIVCAADI